MADPETFAAMAAARAADHRPRRTFEGHCWTRRAVIDHPAHRADLARHLRGRGPRHGAGR